jgi:uncharacterized protein
VLKSIRDKVDEVRARVAGAAGAAGVAADVSLAAAGAHLTLPLFPLSSVLFPSGVMSLRVFELRYMNLVKASLKANTPFGICLIREGAEVGAPALPADVGTLARIDDWDMPQTGILQVKVSGLLRFRVLSHEASSEGLVIARAQTTADDASSPSVALSMCASFLARVIAGRGERVDDPKWAFDDAFWVGMRLTELLPLPTAVKQKMLELTDATMRVEILQRFLSDQGLIASSS